MASTTLFPFEFFSDVVRTSYSAVQVASMQKYGYTIQQIEENASIKKNGRASNRVNFTPGQYGVNAPIQQNPMMSGYYQPGVYAPQPYPIMPQNGMMMPFQPLPTPPQGMMPAGYMFPPPAVTYPATPQGAMITPPLTDPMSLSNDMGFPQYTPLFPTVQSEYTYTQSPPPPPPQPAQPTGLPDLFIGEQEEQYLRELAAQIFEETMAEVEAGNIGNEAAPVEPAPQQDTTEDELFRTFFTPEVHPEGCSCEGCRLIGRYQDHSVFQP